MFGSSGSWSVVRYFRIRERGSERKRATSFARKERLYANQK